MIFCQHEYGKWSKPFNSSNQFGLKRQAKSCVKCGKVVVRRVWWSDWCIAEVINNAIHGKDY